MNKLTTTLAGLALVAGASIAPAFAQGNFFATQPFVFTFTPANSFSVIAAPVVFNPFNGGTAETGFLTLTGGKEEGTSFIYDNSNLLFTSGTTTLTDTFARTTVVPLGSNSYSIASVGIGQKFGDTFNLVPGVPAAVPEASTVISFGALLALGGLAVLRRKSVVKNAA